MDRRVTQASSGPRSLGRYFPIVLLLLILVVIDQALLFRSRRVEPVTAAAVAPVNVVEYAAAADPSRPHLIILGSSRGRDAVDAAMLQQMVDDRKLPYQVFNLSRGDGGTPSALLANLRAYSRVTEDLPAGSQVFYLVSAFEMNFLRELALMQTRPGRDMLDRFVTPDGWARGWREVSGFARWASRQNWKNLPRVDGLLQFSSAPVSLPAAGGRECNFSGLYQWDVLPINDWALRELAHGLKGRFTLLKPPVSTRQSAIDAEFAVDVKGDAYFRRLSAETGAPYLAGFGADLGLGDEHFYKRENGTVMPDCDHLGSDGGRRAVAEAILRLAQ